MAGDYQKITFKNGEAPAINATNLNHMQTQYDKACDKAEELVDTHKAEKASKTDFGHVQVGDRISVSNGVISADEQITPISGEVSYNQSIPGKTVITKTIAIGPGKKLGRLVAYNTFSEASIKGIAFFSNINGTAHSITGQSVYCSAFIDSEHLILILGSITSGLKNVYIDGSNLVLKFYNSDTSSSQINCTIYWEVW